MKKTLLENISFNFLIRIISYVFSFLTIVYITRTLMPEIYGRVSFANSVACYFVMFAALGMPIYGIRTCAEHKNNRKDLSKIFNELFSINILFAFLSAFFFLILIFLVPALHENAALLMIYGIGIFFQALGCEWFYRGLEKFKFLAIVTFFTRLIAFICILLFIHSGKDMLLYAFLAVIAAYGSNLIYFINLPKNVDISFKPVIKKQHIKALFVFFMMSCAVSIYNSLDVTMLGFMTTNFETGLYTLAAKIKIFLAMTGNIVCTAILPRATELWKNGQKKTFFSLAEKSVTWVLTIQFLVTIFCFVFAKEIILLVGSQNYLGCVNAFRVLLLSLLPIGFSNILGEQVLIPCGLEKKLLKAEIVGAAVNFSANLVVIPIYGGIGAATTTVLSEFIVLFMCIYYIKCLLKFDFGLTMVLKMPRILKKSIDELKLKYYKD